MVQLARIRQYYVCYCQPLKDPDGKTYYYEHVTCTWCKDAPRAMVVPRSIAEAQPEDATVGADRCLLMRRVARVLEFADGSTVATAEGHVADTGATPSGQGRAAELDAGQDAERMESESEVTVVWQRG